MSRSIIYIVAMSLILAGCGLTPLYTSGGSNLPNIKMDQFSISGNHDQYLGYFVEHTLRNTIPFIKDQSIEYAINVVCDVETSPAILQSDTSIVKHVNTVQLHYELHHIKSGKLVAKDTVVTKDSYNSPKSLYSHHVSQQRLVEQLAKNASYYLKLRLIQKIKQFEKMDT